MTTATDIYDICSLYFVQAVRRYEHFAPIAESLFCGDSLRKKYTLRCYMYVLAGAMVIGGEYT